MRHFICRILERVQIFMDVDRNWFAARLPVVIQKTLTPSKERR